jgi:hypothetical protein
MATNVENIAKKVERLRRQARGRDERQRNVHDVRAGDVETLMPGAFPESWPRPIVANVIDTTARDLAELIAPLPSINCDSSLVTSQRGKNFSSKRTKIANWYSVSSELKVKMVQAADWYLSYGMVPFIIEPDFHRKTPFIRFDNPMKTYPEFNLRDEVVSYSKVWHEPASVLAAKFPEFSRVIMGESPSQGFPGQNGDSGDSMVEVVKYVDAERYLLYMPGRQNRVLEDIPNPFGKVPVIIAKRPGYDEETRGQFDDVIWVHLARARMALLGMEATEKSVRAPLALPPDVQKVSFGDDAVIRTNSPEKIRRVGVDVPQVAQEEQQILAAEIMQGTRTPPARQGQMDASIITGKGVQALMGSFDTQVKTAQTVIGRALERSLMLCFEMDEKFWPHERKEIRGVASGTPFEDSYIPSKDINGAHTVDVSYGFASGLDPSRALVFLLQLRGDQLVSRDFVQRQLPMDLDVAQLQIQIDNEQTTDALKQGIFAMLSQVGVLAQQGQDPTDVLYKAAQVISMREKGKSMADAILEAFQPKQPAQMPPGQQQPGTPGAPPGMPPGMGPGGPQGGPQGPGGPMPQGGPGMGPGGGQMQPGGQPDLQQLLAGLNGATGQPTLGATVRRRIPAA